MTESEGSIQEHIKEETKEMARKVVKIVVSAMAAADESMLGRTMRQKMTVYTVMTRQLHICAGEGILVKVLMVSYLFMLGSLIFQFTILQLALNNHFIISLLTQYILQSIKWPMHCCSNLGSVFPKQPNSESSHLIKNAFLCTQKFAKKIQLQKQLPFLHRRFHHQIFNATIKCHPYFLLSLPQRNIKLMWSMLKTWYGKKLLLGKIRQKLLNSICSKAIVIRNTVGLSSLQLPLKTSQLSYPKQQIPSLSPTSNHARNKKMKNKNKSSICFSITRNQSSNHLLSQNYKFDLQLVYFSISVSALKLLPFFALVVDLLFQLLGHNEEFLYVQFERSNFFGMTHFHVQHLLFETNILESQICILLLQMVKVYQPLIHMKRLYMVTTRDMLIHILQVMSILISESILEYWLRVTIIRIQRFSFYGNSGT